VLAISTGTGEAGLMTLPIVGSSGLGDTGVMMRYIHFDVSIRLHETSDEKHS